MSTSRPGSIAVALCIASASAAQTQQLAQQGPTRENGLVETVLNALEWRSIGPANMTGRITDVEGIPSPSRTFYVAAATGGIWKTTNNGVTFRALFQNERVISMGDIAIAPSDTLQIWAGTGEEDSRNSISPGGGIYKSLDGGLTWQLMGLEQTEQIARIIVHPTNPDVVWVAALGAVWRTNAERGLYKTTDGGRTWQLKKFVSERAGFVDLVMHPRNPDILFAASYERIRGPYFMTSGGPGSALWQSLDGGESWTEVGGGGFPATVKGRIGIDIARSNPNIMYALVEAESPDGEPGGCREAKAGGCGLYRSEDGGQTWQWRAPNNVRPFYYSQVRVDPADPNRVYWSSTPVNFSTDGGSTVRTTTAGLHVDHHAMWIDPFDPNRVIVGNDGGIGISWDRGGNFLFPNTFAIGQFYNISFDMAVPYNVCGGLQDNGSWCGPSRRASGDITNQMWFNVGGGDGFVTAQDPRDPAIVYSESQGGSMSGRNLRTGERLAVQKPDWQTAYRMWDDSMALVHPDPDVRPDAAAQRRLDEFRRRQLRDSLEQQYLYNWNTPYFLSPHNPDVFYAGANRVLKSTYRGSNLEPISPDLTDRDTMKIRVSTRTTGGITVDATRAETYGTIVSLAESPVRQGLLLAGTDDGNVWITRDDGANWTDLTAKFAGLLPDNVYVSRVEPAPQDANRFYVTFDNHRNGDFTPYVFVTRDGGDSFQSIASNLPTGKPDFVHVVREDPVNPNLLFLGTDVGAYVSLDQGASWRRFMNYLPTVPVHDLRIHPRDRELIAGTHGRSIWVIDIAPLQQLTPQVVAADGPVLFEPAPGLLFTQAPIGGGSTGHAWWRGENRAFGTDIYLYGLAVEDPVRLVITDARSDTVQVLTAPAERGLSRVSWNFRARAEPEPPRTLSPSERRDSLITMRRADAVADSLIRTGMAEELVRRAAAQLKGESQPGGGGRGGRGGGAAGGGRGGRGGAAVSPVQRQDWADRPSEGTPGGGGRGGGRGGGQDQELQRALQAFRAAGVPGVPDTDGGPGGQGELVAAGEYNLSATIDGRTLTTKLRVVTDDGR